jgi:hypothetical protein
MFGSAGGGGACPGGGVLHMNTSILEMDGTIRIDGKNGDIGTSSGGGSGGSVLIEAGIIKGTGSIQANGGDGGSVGGGGGSGGRIAILSGMYSYTGFVSTYGGNSPVEAGAAGTIYKRDMKTGNTILEIYNLGRRPASSHIWNYMSLSDDSARTWLTNSSLSQNPKQSTIDDIKLNVEVYEGFTFDELRLGGGAHLAFETDPRRLRMHTVKRLVGNYEGESYGFLHAGPKQLLVIKDSDYYIPVNLKVYPLGLVQLPSKIMLHKNSIYLGGYLIGVQDLTISECLVNFGPSAAALTRGSPRTLHFDIETVKILNQGTLLMTDSSKEYSLKSKSIEIYPGGSLVGRNVSVISESISVHESARITFDGQGIRCVPSHVYYSGSGGSHAGYGGIGSTARNRPEPFDSIYFPRLFGEAGRAGRISSPCRGGYGGGRLNMTVSGILTVDGTISSRFGLLNLNSF